jgi:hypothetical protein
VALRSSATEGFIAIGMGGKITEDLGQPEAAWRAAKARQDAIASRVVVHTPDAYLDAAVRMMAFATEGTWGDSAILHGGWSWRSAYLGWRGWYGSTCYGWTDRVKRSIEHHTRLGVVRDGPDAGGLGSQLEYSPGIYYNMNEVFLDQVRQYFDYTNDLDLMREIFPVLVGIVATLLVAIAFVALINAALGVLPNWGDAAITLQRAFALPFRPVMWLIGLPWDEAGVAATLMGTKTVLNEFVAYLNLSALPVETFTPRSRLILTYALCGFANFGSLGIMIGGLGAMIPERRHEVVALGLRSILSGTIATCMSGAVAGMLAG